MRWRNRRTELVIASCLLALAPLQAGAGGAGFPDALLNQYVRWVCVGNPAIQCVDQLDTGDFAHTGIECPPPAPNPPCQIDFYPGVLRAAVTLVADDLDPNTSLGFQETLTTVIVEIRLAGQTHVVAEIFDVLDPIGLWGVTAQEKEVFEVFWSGGSVPQNALIPLAEKVLAIATPALGLGGDAVPVLDVISGTPGLRKTPELESDASQLGNELASVARWRLEYRFARLVQPLP